MPTSLEEQGVYSIEEWAPAFSVPKTGARALSRAEDLAAQEGIPASVSVQESNIDAVVSSVKQKYGDKLATSVQRSLQSRAEPSATARQLSIQSQQIAKSMGYQEFFIEESLNVDSPLYDPDQVNFMINYRQLSEKLSEKLEKEWEDATWLGIGKDFLTEIIRATLVGDWQDLTGIGAERGREMTALMQENPDEFAAKADKWLLENSSLLGNFFEKAQLYQDALNRGYDPEEASRKFWGGFGVGATLLGLPFSAAKSVSIAQRFGKGFKAWKASRAAGTTGEALEEGVASVAKPSHVGINEVPFGESNAFEEGNTLIQKIQQDKGKGFFGYEATPDEIRAATVAATSKFEKLFNKTITSVTPPTWRDPTLTFTLGKSNGAGWVNTYWPQRLVDDLKKEGYVAEVFEDPTGLLSERYRVRVKQNMSFQMVAPAMQLPEVSNAITELYKKVFGSGAMFDMDGHVATLKSHNGLRSIGKSVKPYFDKVDKLDRKKAEHLYRIMDEVRDGADAAFRTSFTESQLAERWFRRTGETALPPDILEAYRAIRTVEDVAYWMDAQIVLRDFITNGFDAVVVDGKRYIGKPIPYDEVPANARILHVPSKSTLKKGDPDLETLVQNNNKVYKLWESEAELDGHSFEYVVNPELDILKYSDVLSYNPGGHRSYRTANYFMTIGSGEGRAFMVARTHDEAKLARKELLAIQTEYRALGRPLAELTDELDDVIKSNPNWHKEIENTEDLKEFAAKYKLDFDKEISFKAKDGLVVDVQNPMYKRPVRLHYGNQRTRDDNPLLNVGGALPNMDSSIKSIFDGVENAAYQFSFADATQRMQSAWLKAFWAKGYKADPHVNPSVLFQQAGETLKASRGRTPEQELLIDEWDAINRRLSVKDSVSLAAERTGKRLQEFVLGKFGEKAASAIPGVDDLLRLGFQSAFGFLNTSAFVIQAAQVPLIMALSPKAGSRAALGIRSFMIALQTGSDESIVRLAKVLSITPDEAKQVLSYFHTTRPHDVMMSSIDKNTMLGFGYSLQDGNATAKGISAAYRKFKEVGGKGLQLGLKPYELGEQFTVTTAHLTAILEFLQRNPGMSLAEGADFITRRASALTSNMNNAARGAYQTGVWRLPTQWLSYSFRSMEMMVSGRHLTKMERARMAMYFLATSGVGILGVDSASDYLAEFLGADPEDPYYYTAVRYGLYDAVLSYGFSELTDSEVRTALGARIAPLDGIADLVSKINEKAVPEVVLGPSGGIVGSGLTAVFKSLHNMWNGYDYAAAEDLETAFRNVSSFNTIAAVHGMLKSDAVRSRNGNTVPIKTNPAQAILKVLGVPSQAEKEIYTLKSAAYMQDKEVRAFRKEVFRLYDIAINVALKEGDHEEFAKRVNEIAAMVNESDLSEYDKDNLKNTLRKYKGDELSRLLIQFSERQQEFYRKQLEKIGEF